MSLEWLHPAPSRVKVLSSPSLLTAVQCCRALRFCSATTGSKTGLGRLLVVRPKALQQGNRSLQPCCLVIVALVVCEVIPNPKTGATDQASCPHPQSLSQRERDIAFSSLLLREKGWDEGEAL